MRSASVGKASLILNLLVAAAPFLHHSSTGASAWSTTQTPGISLQKDSRRTATARKMTESSAVNAAASKPRLPIPAPLYSDVPGTWAYDTMSRRVDEEILQRTFDDNKGAWETEEFSDILERFNALRKELQNAGETKLGLPLPPPSDCSEARRTEWEEWKQIMEPFVAKGDTWLTAPWMVAEFYVYRRLVVDVIQYWDEYDRNDPEKKNPGYLYDPFIDQKHAGLESSVASAEGVLAKINNLGGNGSSIDQGGRLAASIALWGNKMDLSLWPADAKTASKDIFSAILDKATEGLLHDDSSLLVEHFEKLKASGGGNIDIIVDNAGFELITDLVLAQYLTESGIAKCVTFQLKSHPTFVSDALEKDLLEHVNHLADFDDEAKAYPNVKISGAKWQEYLNDGRWKCTENNFWVQGFPMWEMTEPLRSDLRDRCDLAFVKGDANYRRLLGDCQWDYSTDSFQDVVGHYFPCPVCALRTLKAEIGCGMEANQVDRASKLDPNWQTNGRFGVLQFGTGESQ
ncbi:unnamed protein product [Pseudo-nitzschia multistriata]|uniref:Sugar phosphate phosphatase n=1 Tax=Pseudo-nitzschia multistriata TaxID=183589 RepID=A0A448ZR67_9STRA|nr:unnamed protein product [Pseudo-nitzschia multistriata]